MPTQIDSGISQAVRAASKIFTTKNIFGDNRIEATLTAEKTSFKRNTVTFERNLGTLNNSSLVILGWIK